MNKKGFTQHLRLGNKQSNYLTSKKGVGFTLIELLVVIAIIGLLATFAAIALGSAREKARDAKRVADIKSVQTALELYFNSTGSYPDFAGQTPELGVDVTCLGGNGLGITCPDPIYIGLIPADPQSPDSIFTYTPIDEFFGICFEEICPTYQIDFTLEGGAGDLGSGPKCASPEGVTEGSC